MNTIGVEINQVIEHQKSIADYLISTMRIIDPTCIVAGGACRDWMFGKAAKDIDLFFYDGGYTANENQKRIEKLFNVEFHKLGKDYADGTTGGHISIVLEGFVNGQIVNLIGWKSRTYNVTQQFPAWNAKMHYIPEYGNDLRRGIENLVSLSQQYCKEIYVTSNITLKYWQKLRNKFPDCRIVIIADDPADRIDRLHFIREVSKGKGPLSLVTNLANPTKGELDMVPMLYPGKDLRDPWFRGVDITDIPPSTKPSVKEDDIYSIGGSNYARIDF